MAIDYKRIFPITEKYQDLLYKNAFSRSLFTVWGVVIQELRESFRQFFTWRYPLRSFFRSLSIVFSSIVRLFLGRSLKFSFAFAGEDRMIEGILKPNIILPGYYVDVGCNHPKFLSNTYGLYRKGWRGVCIDANQQLIDKFGYYRPKDIALCALVSDTDKERAFYRVQNDVLSTMEEGFVNTYKEQGLTIEKVTLPAQSLTALLKSVNAPLRFDVLSIDAEDHDVQVLRSLDLNHYVPRLIIIEDESFDPMDPFGNELFVYLTEKGYVLEGYALKNLYFKLEEKMETTGKVPRH